METPRPRAGTPSPQDGGRLDNRTYYDDFAEWYERERGRGYHQMLDDLEVSLVERYGRGADVLEAGCGTGLILERIAGFAARARGVDLSAGMLAKARARGLEVVQASVTSLPYADESFDLVCSFKVLAHIEDIRGALSEMARVTRPAASSWPSSTTRCRCATWSSASSARRPSPTRTTTRRSTPATTARPGYGATCRRA